jgi:NAD(P)-dependent dehydrogenase (short-subunit alcohol dehydrogenase family)
MTIWSTADIPSQEDRSAVVTGGTSGIGLATAKLSRRRSARENPRQSRTHAQEIVERGHDRHSTFAAAAI